MRTSDGSKARVAVSDGHKRGSRGLKIKLARPQQPSGPSEVGPSEVGPSEASSSALYSNQLWQATSTLQAQLTCDKSLYFPGMFTPGPQLKQLPSDSWDPHAAKRARFMHGYGKQQRCRDSDNSPRSTPQKPARGQDCSNLARTASHAASSSSGAYQQRQRLESEVCESYVPAWSAGLRRKRRQRLRLQAPAQWCRHLQQRSGCPSAAAAASDPMELLLQVAVTLQGARPEQQTEAVAGGEAAVRPEQQTEAAAGVEAALRPEQQTEAAAGVEAALRPEPQTKAAAGVEAALRPEPQTEAAAGVGAAAVARQQLASNAMEVEEQQAAWGPSPARPGREQEAAAGEEVLAVLKQQQEMKAKQGSASPVSPVETSQSSDLTCHEVSPHIAAAPLTSWPSSSTEGDSQVAADSSEVEPGPGSKGKGAAAVAEQPDVKSCTSSESLLRQADVF